MKRRKTVKRPDGSMEIEEYDDDAPAMTKAKMAAQGRGGDDRLAHVNQWEEMLLKKLGGSGTRNPKTGMKEFYSTYDYTGRSGMPGEYNPKKQPAFAADIINSPPTSNWNNGGFTAQAINSPPQRPTGATADVRQPLWAPDRVGGGNGGGAFTAQPINSPPQRPTTQQGYNDYFGSLAPGQSMQWGGGTVTAYGDGGGVNYKPAGSQYGVDFSNQTSAADLAKYLQGGQSVAQNYGQYGALPQGFGLAGAQRYYDYEKNRLGNVNPIGAPGGGYGGGYGGAGEGGNIVSAQGINSQPQAPNSQLGATNGPSGQQTPFDPQTSAQMTSDFNAYFQNTPPGTVTPFGNGYITMGQNGQATYTNPQTGETYTFNQSTPINQIYAASPGMAAVWAQQYGGQPGQQSGTDDFFNLPLNIMPQSWSNSTNIGNQGSTSGGINYSGLPEQYQQALLAALMPQLNNSITNMEGNIDKYTGQALGSYNQEMANALRNDVPLAIQNLSRRGIIGSTAGNEMLGNVMAKAATDASGKGYETAMQAALLKSQMPSVLAQIGQLGQTSYGNQASNSWGNTYGTSNSYQSDPTVMYRTMADLIKYMM